MRHQPLANRNTQRDKLVKQTIENEQKPWKAERKLHTSSLSTTSCLLKVKERTPPKDLRILWSKAILIPPREA